MKISYNWLQSFFKKKLPAPEKLADLLTMHAFEVELAGKSRNDVVLDVDVLPNRAHDCLSHLGIAREIAALLKYPFRPIDYAKRIKASQNESVKKLVKVEVKDKDLCPRYTARAIIDVKVSSAPQWIQERLKICGLRPINNVVDITNYVMLETGQPLHAFDADKLLDRDQTGQKTIIVRRARGREKIITLDNEEYNLDENILVIADEENPVCIAGIKGGKGPEIDGQTKRVILEAANFSPGIIRRGSRQLKLKTDASWRFEHQLDPNLTQEAIDMAAYLIQEIAGGQVLNGIVDVYPNKIRPKKIKLNIEQVKSLLGISISKKEIIDILKRLGFELQVTGYGVLVTVPTRRLDVSIPEDLIEEIGRLYGYEKIPSQLPTATLIPSERNEDLVYQNKVKEILVNLGFSEIYNYSFIGEREIELYQTKPALIEVANPVSQEQKYLRPSLILNLLKNVKENKKYFEEVRLFEIGKVFFLSHPEAKVKGSRGKNKKFTGSFTSIQENVGYQEQKKLAGIISLGGKFNQTPDAQEFYRLKGVIDSLLNKLRISDQWYDDRIMNNELGIMDLFHSGRRAEIKIGDDFIGRVGEITPDILEKLDVKSRVAAFELDFEKLVQLATEERIYLPPSKYPAVVRDIALLVDRGTKVVEVLNLINAAGGPLVRDVDLFDMYEGEEVPEGKKNLAFHIIFQADDHTLTDKEVNTLQEKIIRALEEEGGWEVRRQ
jgi:phenylalanyl-tRNA synthetase beta chain